MMSYYIKESPATTTTATSTTTGCGETELDFDLLFSLDNFEEKGMFFIDEEQQRQQQEKKGMEDWSSFPMVPATSLHEIIELDAFDEVSLLTSSEDDTPCMVAPVPAVKPEVTKTSAKRKRNFHESHDEVASQCSSTMTNNKRQKSLHCNSSSSSSPSTAVEYINQFIKALNFGEFDEMQKSLQSLCSQKVKVTKHFYPTIEELRTQEEYNRTHPNDKQEEFISTMQFQTLPDFLHYLNLIGMMIPDGAFSIDNVRPCFENVNTSVYMASFTYSGTLLCGNMNLLSNKMSLLEYNEDMMLRVINHSCATKSIRNNYKTEGSVALYVNKEGMVNEIEFFETRCVFV